MKLGDWNRCKGSRGRVKCWVRFNGTTWQLKTNHMTMCVNNFETITDLSMEEGWARFREALSRPKGAPNLERMCRALKTLDDSDADFAWRSFESITH